MFRADGAVNPNPVAMVEGLATPTSSQAVQSLLCDACEQTLSTNGERYSVSACFRPNKTFPFRDDLLRNPPHDRTEEDLYYSGSRLMSLDLEKLRYFAASIFWRASVIQWPIPPDGKPLRNRLGKYEELFRRYLLAEAEFPQNARFMLWVASEPDPPRMITFPGTTKHQGFHTHGFYIPGLTFILIVGATLPKEIIRIYNHNPSEIPILVFNSRTTEPYSWLKRELRTREQQFKELIAKIRGSHV